MEEFAETITRIRPSVRSGDLYFTLSYISVDFYREKVLLWKNNGWIDICEATSGINIVAGVTVNFSITGLGRDVWFYNKL